MEGVKDAMANIRRLSPNDGSHYFYGYYDNPAFSGDGSLHLCHRAGFWNRVPGRGDECGLGFFSVAIGEWTEFAQTGAFNFQQGAMLQWNPLSPNDEVIYNAREGDEYRAVVHNVRTGSKRALPRAVANVSPDGKWGLSINMNRVFDFRPGYGYSGVRDEFYDIPQPKDDGIWVVNMQTGEDKFILSYEEMGRLFSVNHSDKLVVNHITFSPNCFRLLFLVRTFPRDGGGWTTGMGTIDRDGGGFHLLNPMSMASHYHWRDGDHLLVWASRDGLPGMYLFTDQSGEARLVDPEFFTKDIHCIYSPDGKRILGDGYPDKGGYRQIFLYNALSERGVMLLRVKSDPMATGDYRSDLHNRWSRDGRLVSFDSTHEGFRGLYLADLGELLKHF